MGRRGKGEGSIHQRQDGLWAAELHLGYVDGKRRRKTVYGKTKQAVAKKPKELQRLHGLGVDLTAERQTIEQFLNDWLEHTVKEHNEESTYRSYADNTRLHIVPYIGHLYLDKLTPAHVQMMLNELPNKGLSACSAAYVQAILRSALSLAEEWGYVPRNVAKLAKAPRQEQRMIEPLTLEQACAILEVVHGHRLATLYQVALSLGLRRGEMLDLRWRDVNFTDKSLHVKQGKTEASKRTLALPDELVDALRGHWERQQQERLTLGINWKEYGLLFPSEAGTPISGRNLLRHFKGVLRQAGLPTTIRFHDLRHSCATFMLAQGVPQRVVMEVLGHSQISVTMNIIYPRFD